MEDKIIVFQILVDSGVARNFVRVYNRLLQILRLVSPFCCCCCCCCLFLSLFLFLYLFFLVRRGKSIFFGRKMHRFDESVLSPSASHDRLASANKLSNYPSSPFAEGSRVNSFDSPKWRACSQALTDGSSYLGGKGEIKTRFSPFGSKQWRIQGSPSPSPLIFKPN